MRYSKPALSYEQQLELLASRGLHVADRDRALHWLKRNGYFRLSAYFLPFKIKDTDQFLPGASFEKVTKLYKFDADLRLLVMQAIDRVEIAFRTSITYHFAHVLGPFGYCESTNFVPFVPSPGPGVPPSGFDHHSFLTRIESEVEQEREEFIKHYRKKYSSEKHLPIWMATEIMSLGMISKMTDGTKKSLRKKIALDFHIAQSQLTSWLRTLTYVRNICAHHSRLWNRELSLKPEVLREWKADELQNNRIYYVLMVLEHIMRHAAPKSRWKDRVMLHILSNGRSINVLAMGFPVGWVDRPPWSLSRIY